MQLQDLGRQSVRVRGQAFDPVGLDDALQMLFKLLSIYVKFFYNLVVHNNLIYTLFFSFGTTSGGCRNCIKRLCLEINWLYNLWRLCV